MPKPDPRKHLPNWSDGTLTSCIRVEMTRLRRDADDLLRLRGEIARLRTATSPGPDVRAATDPKPQSEQLPKESWADVGFATPQAALQTRGWAVVNGNRERFKDSVHVTPAARKTLEDMFVQMATASQDPDKDRFLQDVLDHKLDVEDGILMPMMAEHQKLGYTGYRILAQQSPAPDELLLQLQTDLMSAPAKAQTLKLQRFGPNWKVVIDEEFIKTAR